ncbi:MAG: pyruvate, phosphate dikinase [Candidatus Coatesbacteria bacterium]|nr:MAG: pyruvate, phosphate dikinase [Candidatus Coatesbacteria bacterium]
MDTKYVYFFGDGATEGTAKMRDLLGGKGAGLAEMTNVGIPVPPGFTITTEACVYYYQNGDFPPGLEEEVEIHLGRVEQALERRFGDVDTPLLLSVRSGSRVSMPGMMDTVLNIGLNDKTAAGLARDMGDPRPAYDSYRRFVQMYGDVVLGLKPETEDDVDPFEEIIERMKNDRGVALDVELTAEDLQALVKQFKAAVKERKGRDFPAEPREQLWGAIRSVFASWDNPRAIAYRQLNNIPDEWGTAANVQSMVFGNLGDDSGSGVAFTRNPATGEKGLYGEFLVNAQGEDVVAGIRTPLPIAALAEEWPDIYGELDEAAVKLETHFRDVQDLEFTVERGRLWLLQTRAGKRTAHAALTIAIDMVEEGLMNREEALLSMEPEQLNQFLRPVFNPVQKEAAVREGRVIAKGLNAGPGAAAGKVVFNAADALEFAERGEKVILVRAETSPEDIKGMSASQGILTERGGMTSHAALVGRQMGKVCVVGCSDIHIDYKKRRFAAPGDVVVKEGEEISIDGTTGEVLLGALETEPSEIKRVLLDETLAPEDSPLYRKFAEFMSWADERRRLMVWTNADQPDQTAAAVKFGAQGIGLCRTEHMFFGGDRITAMRKMILARDEAGRRAALEELRPMQQEDFAGIFRALGGRPAVIRTLDPPLHEFLPHEPAQIEKLAEQMGVPKKELVAKIRTLREQNPMLGHRGCRLGIVYPEITEMQTRAIIGAAVDCLREGLEVRPEIMIPLVSHVNELYNQILVVRRVAEEIMDAEGVTIPYKVGTMIEVPRSALTADEIALVADFFSFGTNDLTQTTFGFSRDDAPVFLRYYVDHMILKDNPFETVDVNGVGLLMEIAVEKGRVANPQLEIGICGEHGGDPATIAYCHRIGLDYVSCSPYRVPVARLAAAQAAIKAAE